VIDQAPNESSQLQSSTSNFLQSSILNQTGPKPSSISPSEIRWRISSLGEA